VVFEDGIVHREFALTGEALHHCLAWSARRTFRKGEPKRKVFVV
jgi:nicotinamidase-related amidase